VANGTQYVENSLEKWEEKEAAANTSPLPLRPDCQCHSHLVSGGRQKGPSVLLWDPKIISVFKKACIN